MEPENIKNVIDIVLTVNKYKLKENTDVIFDLNKGDKIKFNATLRDISHTHMHLVDIVKIPGFKDLPNDFHTHSRFSGEDEPQKTRLFQNDNKVKIEIKDKTEDKEKTQDEEKTEDKEKTEKSNQLETEKK